MKVDFIGIGAEKSATTWVWECLAEHPDVEMSNPKEVNFFNENFHLGVEWYFKHFKVRNGNVHYGEISPLYMDHPEAAGRIRALFPEAIIFAVLRNPFDRAISHLLMDAGKSFADPAGVPVEQLREMAGMDDKYVRRSCYAAQLRPFFETFPPDRLRIWFYEDLVSSPSTFIKIMYQELGLNPDYVPEGIHRKANVFATFRFHGLYTACRGISVRLKGSTQGRQVIDWLRRSGIWPRLIRLMIDEKVARPQVGFDDLFTAKDKERLLIEINALEELIGRRIPASWRASGAHYLERR